MFPIYPYINVNDLNLDYLLRKVKELNETVVNFINFNTIKYADPLEWNITTQYQGNTVVMDNVNHIAYLSTQPVPAGVLLTDTDYWTAILDLRSFYEAVEHIHLYDTYQDAVNDDTLIVGDVFGTYGFTDPGVGAGIYLIHDTSEPYFIPFGDKYAELCYSDEIDVDALGADHTGLNTDVNCEAIETAIALAFHNKPMSPTGIGFYTGGSTIKFGPFTYKITRPVVIPQDVSNLIFKGTNHNSLIWGAGSGTVFAIPQRSDSNYSLYWGFENLSFIGGMNAISFNMAGNIFIKDCAFFNTGNGINFNRCVGADITDCTFVNCAIGVYIDNITTTVHISNSVFRECVNGFYVTNGTNGVHIDTTIIEYCTTLGFYVYNAENVSFSECWIEANNATVLNSDVFADTIVNSGFPDLSPSVVTITNSSATPHNVTIRNVKHNTWKITNKFDGLINGSLNDNDGIKLDYSKRKFIACNVSVIDLSTITTSGIGFLKVHSPNGNYFATINFDYGNTMTITKIAGSLTDPYSNVNGGISFVGLTADQTIIECEL